MSRTVARACPHTSRVSRTEYALDPALENSLRPLAQLVGSGTAGGMRLAVLLLEPMLELPMMELELDAVDLADDLGPATWDGTVACEAVSSSVSASLPWGPRYMLSPSTKSK